MKIIQVHNYYQYAGGEDVVVQNEKTLLEAHHHDVFQYTRHNNEIAGIQGKLNVLLNTHYSAPSRDDFKQTLALHKPDVVHVHNFFPLITPSVFDACRQMRIPSVLTLHNYRLLHPNGYLIDNEGHIDERSIQGSAYQCVTDKVYRNSMLQTAVVAHMIEYHRKAKTWDKAVNRFIALSQFARSKFIEGGLPAEKIVVKPNFIADFSEKTGKGTPPDHYFLFVGRLSSEKGVELLIDTWIKYNISIPVYIVGEGPLQDKVLRISKDHSQIKLLGKKSHAETLGYIQKARALVFPSTWYEGFPMTIVEALSLSTPVVASDIGSQAEIITDNFNGLHFQVGNSEALAETIKKLANNALLEKLRVNARQSYLENYTPELNYNILMDIYQQAIQDCDPTSKQ